MIISNDIFKAITLLNNEKLVAIPTETVYGLAGNIYSEKAIDLIFKTKQRPSFNPLIVHISGINRLSDIVSSISVKAILLAEAFWPGPLTLVLPKKNTIPDKITAGKPTVAVRVPNHPLTLKLLQQLDFPLAAPSANPFNRISPTTPEHVALYFKDELPMILDGGICQKGIESTIIGFENNLPVVYRLGTTTIKQIETVVGTVKLQTTSESPLAPGMLKKHYAPRTKTVLVTDVLKELDRYTNKRVGVLSFSKAFKHPLIIENIILSTTKNLEEAASRLYNALHSLDSKQLDVIIAEQLPDQGLGKAINDKLKRASIS